MADLDAGIARLRDRGLFEGDPPVLSNGGRELRESIEVATDRQQVPILRAIGDDYDELLAILEPWAGLVVAGGGFLTSVEQIPAAWGRLD